jgi:PAS domain S-box-containing protein/putative nucleotidyltransferase with HDIG domain
MATDDKKYHAGHGIDTTEGARAEEDLISQALIFENISDGIIMTDMEGNIIRWNPAAERMFGYYKDETFRKTLSMLTTKITKGALHDGRWIGEMKFIRKDGTEGVCETRVIPLRDTNDTITAVFGVCRDITEHKQAQVDLKRSYDQLRETLITTVNALASAAEMRDPYTAGHQRRATLLACAIAEEMGLTEEQFDGLRLAGLIHDIGKINIPTEILNKPGRISDIEFSIIKTHPREGYNLLKEIEFPWPIAQIVLQHHERLDGSGYPLGLKDGGIMEEARILAVADVVEAMASHRPYRPALGIEVALEEIAKNRGILYDPDVADVCTSLFIEKGFVLEQEM